MKARCREGLLNSLHFFPERGAGQNGPCARQISSTLKKKEEKIAFVAIPTVARTVECHLKLADFTGDRIQKMRIFVLCEAREGTVKESSEMVDEWIKYDNYYGISTYGFF